MKKILICLSMGLIPFCSVNTNAAIVTLIDQGDVWEYAILPPELWGGGSACWTCPGTWDSVGYDYVDCNNLSYTSVNAAFGNPYSLPYSTYWEADTDLALRKTFNIEGIISGNLTLNVASDNGFIAFFNGQQIAKEYANGYTSYWEYSFSIDNSFFVQGINTFEVLAADHGGATFFDMQLTADIEATPVPEPSTFIFFGISFIGLIWFTKLQGLYLGFDG